MLPPTFVAIAVAAAPAQPLRVALVDGPGVAGRGLAEARQLLGADEGIELTMVTPREIRSGALDRVDAVVFMGGNGALQGKTLGPEGRERVRAFVRAGGGYLGVCAGAYLAMQGPERSAKLRLVAAENLTGARWKRGVAPVRVEAVGTDDELVLHFANGPLFARAPVDTMAPFVTLARFRSNVYRAEHGTRPGQMPGTPAILVSRYGRGRVLLFSPHPLLDRPGEPRAELITRGVRWLAAGGPVAEGTSFAYVFSD